MGDMLVAHEDDVPKNRSLKVSGHCALDSGLGWANTFAPYCIYIPPPEIINCNTYHLLDFLMLIDGGCGRQRVSCVGL